MDLKKPLSLREVIQVCEKWRGKSDSLLSQWLSVSITSFDSLSKAHSGSLVFMGENESLTHLYEPPAAAFCEDKSFRASFPTIHVTSIHSCIHQLLLHYHSQFVYCEETEVAGSIHPSAVIEGTVKQGATVGAGCYVGKYSVIEKGAILQANVTVLEHCRIGKNCLIQPGVVIGSDGFGFFKEGQKIIPMKHSAGVVLGEEVWVGANTVIASGVLNPTRIERECKIDSHVQIAHNVELGEGSQLASQSGVAGSTQIGKRAKIGGAASIAGHLHLGDDVTIAAKSGVTKNWNGPITLAGFPAQNIKNWRRQVVRERNGTLDFKGKEKG